MPEGYTESFLQMPDKFYSKTHHGDYSMKDHVNSLSDTLRLIFWHEEGHPERSYLLYVTEDYYLKFVDVTDIQTGGSPTELYSKNLISVIRSKLTRVKLKDTHWNALSLVEENKLYILGWKYKDTDFLVWISLGMSSSHDHSIKIYPQKTSLKLDSRGQNSLTSGKMDDYWFILATTLDDSGVIQVSFYNISQAAKGKIDFIYYTSYGITQFYDWFEKRPLTGEFNFRDLVYYKAEYKYLSELEPQPRSKTKEQHYVIASCYNCGIVFFRIHDYVAPNGTEVQYINMTYIYKEPTIGRIFTEKSYNLQKSDFTFFTSLSSPPVIFEFLIDETMNVNMNKVYSDNSRSQRYKDSELITVNNKFIAQLLYDRKLLKQVIRIYYRNETNFGVGHIHIHLEDYKFSISGIQFLSYFEGDRIYVRNMEKWEIYDIQDPEFIIDTRLTDNLAYDYWAGQRFGISLTAWSEDELNIQQRMDIWITCFSWYNIDIINTLKGQETDIKYAYGDPDFEFPISDYFVGPDLNFTVELTGTSDGNMDIHTPVAVFPGRQEPMKVDFESDYKCSDNVFNQYRDDVRGETMISFYCIQSDFIEHHLFTMKDMSQVQVSFSPKCLTPV